MSKTEIREDEDAVFGVNIKEGGILTDVQGGAASLSGKSLVAIRDGAPIELDPNAGVTFAKVGTVDGVYSATFDRTAMTEAGGTAFVQTVGDDLKFIPNAEVVAGEALIEGVEDSVCIVAATAVPSPTAGWSVC